MSYCYLLLLLQEVPSSLETVSLLGRERESRNPLSKSSRLEESLHGFRTGGRKEASLAPKQSRRSTTLRRTQEKGLFTSLPPLYAKTACERAPFFSLSRADEASFPFVFSRGACFLPSWSSPGLSARGFASAGSGGLERGAREGGYI